MVGVVIMKIVFVVFIFCVVSCFVLFFCISENQRWLLFYKASAEEYAIALLKGKRVKTPDQFIDFTVSSNNDYVIFSKNGKDVLYGYFPSKPPINYSDDFQGKEWESLSGNWYY